VIADALLSCMHVLGDPPSFWHELHAHAADDASLRLSFVLLRALEQTVVQGMESHFW
jgi:hypothetical protein